MQLTDIFKWGQYEGLTLKEVYQGTLDIDKNLLEHFICNSLNEFLRSFSDINTQVLVKENKIILQSENIEVLHGDFSVLFSENLDRDINKGKRNMPESIKKFNSKYHKKPLGGDPEYLQFCLEKLSTFNLDEDVKLELEKLEINKLIGIKVTKNNINIYSYKTRFLKEHFKFKKVEKTAVPTSHDENFYISEHNGAYGFDDDTINEAFDGDPENYWNID